MKVLLGFLIYAAGVAITSGFLLADFLAIGSRENANKDYRSLLGLCVGISLIPVAWLLCPFLTGFFEHGWTLSRPSETKEAR